MEEWGSKEWSDGGMHGEKPGGMEDHGMNGWSIGGID